MSRKAFETEARKHGLILDRLDKSGVYVQLITEQAWVMWNAATAAALERAAEEVEKVNRLFYFRTQQDIAQACAKAIRTLKDKP